MSLEQNTPLDPIIMTPTRDIRLPLLLTATVVKGFGRGSKMLGIPTANMSMDDLGTLVDDLPAGIWYGWACLKGHIYPSVTSVGWNPYFKNQKKTVEPHLIHEFEDDFYGEKLRLLICGFIRPERDFPSLDALITEIRHDIERAKEGLERPPHSHYGSDGHEQLWTTMNSICPNSSLAIGPPRTA